MIINVVLCIQNSIDNVGISTILKNNLVVCNIIKLNSYEEIITTLCDRKIDLIFVDISTKTLNREFVEYLCKFKPKLSIVLYSKEQKISVFLKEIIGERIKIIRSNDSEKLIKSTIDELMSYSKGTRIKRSGNNKLKSNDNLNILSNREYEVAYDLIKGHSVSEISKRLGVSLQTVSTFKQRIYKKTGITNLIQLIELVKTS